MNKLYNAFFVFFFLPFSTVWAQNPEQQCSIAEKSLNVINQKDSKSLEVLHKGVMQSTCNVESIFSDVNNEKFLVRHGRLRCKRVDMCLAGVEDVAAISDAKKILEGVIPTSALIAILAEENGNGIEYNFLENRFDESKNSRSCPKEKLDEKCEEKIKRAVASVGGKFFSRDQSVKGRTDNKSVLCDQYKSLNKICKMSEERSKEILSCEKNKLTGCLDKEQVALAHLLDYHKKNEALFLALEKQLCTNERMASRKFTLKHGPVNYEQKRISDSEELNEDLKEEREEESGSPSRTSIIRVGRMENDFPDVDESTASSSFGGSQTPVSSSTSSNTTENAPASVDVNDEDFVLPSEYNVANSPSLATEGLVNNSNWSNTFSTPSSVFPSEENILEAKKITPEEKKKKDEADALVSKIESLKEKLEGMNAKVEELKSKAEEITPTEKEKLAKETLEKEKAVADLKKEIADLQAVKKKAQDSEVSRIAESRIENSRATISSSPGSSDFSRRENDKVDFGNREFEKTASSQQMVNSNLIGSRAPASVSEATPSSSNSQNSSSGIVLKNTSGSDTSIVYMTEIEVQKYPFRLEANASDAEIEKMLSENKGAKILLGSTTQIVPILENGKIKYKRVKVSIVQNEKDKLAAKDKEVSSLADLKKREEQTKADQVLRYQIMKAEISLPASKK